MAMGDGALKKKEAEIIAVSKTFPINQIYPLINHGHKHFGENQVQEALEKWTDIKNDFNDIKFHMTLQPSIALKIETIKRFCMSKRQTRTMGQQLIFS